MDKRLQSKERIGLYRANKICLDWLLGLARDISRFNCLFISVYCFTMIGVTVVVDISENRMFNINTSSD